MDTPIPKMLPYLDRPTFREDKRKWNLLPRIPDGHHHFSMGNFDPKEASLKIISQGIPMV